MPSVRHAQTSCAPSRAMMTVARCWCDCLQSIVGGCARIGGGNERNNFTILFLNIFPLHYILHTVSPIAVQSSSRNARVLSLSMPHMSLRTLGRCPPAAGNSQHQSGKEVRNKELKKREERYILAVSWSGSVALPRPKKYMRAIQTCQRYIQHPQVTTAGTLGMSGAIFIPSGIVKRLWYG